MKIDIGSVVLKGLPPEYARALERGLAGELQRAFSRGGKEPRRVAAGVVQVALDAARWRRTPPGDFVREVAGRIQRETMR